MTDPKEAKHLSYKDSGPRYIGVDWAGKGKEFTIVKLSPEQTQYWCDLNKAYNTVKAERDALYALIEGLEKLSPRDKQHNALVRKLKTQAQTIKGK